MGLGDGGIEERERMGVGYGWEMAEWEKVRVGDKGADRSVERKE